MLEVLFVCTGNICRSPLAEAFLADRSDRLLEGGVRVRSAGTWGRSGHPPTPETVAAGAERGLDIEGHGATPLTAELVEAADLVLGLTTEHRDEVVRMVSDADARTFTLKELAALVHALDSPPRSGEAHDARARIAEAHALRSGPRAPRVSDLDVSDPLGYGPDVYRAIAWEIEEGVDALVRGLFGARERAGAGEG